jgi:hypothetical protein
MMQAGNPLVYIPK